MSKVKRFRVSATKTLEIALCKIITFALFRVLLLGGENLGDGRIVSLRFNNKKRRERERGGGGKRERREEERKIRETMEGEGMEKNVSSPKHEFI